MCCQEKFKSKLIRKGNFFESILIQANQCRTDKLNLKEKIKAVENKIASVSDLVAISVFHAKIGEVQNEVYVSSNLVTINVLDKKIRVESKIPVLSDLVKKMNHITKIPNNKQKNYHQFWL